MEADSRYEPLPAGWSRLAEANAHLVAGRMDRYVEICTDMAGQSGFAHAMGLASLTFGLPAMGRAAEARAIADEALAVGARPRQPVRDGPCVVRVWAGVHRYRSRSRAGNLS